ncbi:heme o synthase [Priestia endophytica]|uniref:heme o synthase n=1 Tax=Priestia endophytica TaxID=135735 RepID=UPI00124DEBA8|nr:heme o synthase [Priestia endophytica]KAB2496168.1 protoheme IX farnesyltransferase [Priestia endophytica]
MDYSTESVSLPPQNPEIKTTVWQEFLTVIKIGIVNSSMLTTFTGFWLSLKFNEKPFTEHLDLAFFTLVGSAFIIAGSCSLNNYIDRDIDPLMKSKQKRPTVTGRFHPLTVLLIGLGLTATGLFMLLAAHVIAALIGVVGILTYIFFYTMWSKRRYTTNTVIGSISGAVPPLIGWGAVDPTLSLEAWILFLILFIWQPPHFFALAILRAEEYRAAKVPMLPVVYGNRLTKRQMIVWITCLIPLPFYLYELGITFVVIASILTIGWLLIGVSLYWKLKTEKWARIMFVYSVNYVTFLFVSMILASFFT